MKKNWIKWGLLCLMMAIALSSYAQEPQERPEREKREIPSPENNARRITKEFKQIFQLTDTEYDKVYELYLKMEKDMLPSDSERGNRPQGRGMGRPSGGPSMSGGMGRPPQGNEFQPREDRKMPEGMKEKMEEMKKEMGKRQAKSAKTIKKKMKKILKGDQYLQWEQWEAKRQTRNPEPAQ